MNCSGTGGSSAGRGSASTVGLGAALAGGGAAVILLAALAPAAAGPPHNNREQPSKTLQVPLIAISISDQRLTLYDKGQAVARAPVSTGMAGHPTPTGIFSVIQKQVFHRSNIYSGAPMPFMQRITWSGVALHAGVLPGYPASHGCIRMPEGFAVRLYHMTKPGARVVVARHAVVPVPFENPHLFTLPKTGALTTSGIAPAEPTLKTAESKTPAVMSDVADAAARAIAGLTPKPGEANGAEQPSPAELSAAPTNPADIKPVSTIPAQTMAPAGVAPAQAALEPYGPERPLRAGSITVFVSRKESKVFVRKGFQQILAMPVTIEHPELALGTHIFTAIDAKSDGMSFEWVAMSLAGNAPKRAEPRTVSEHKRRRIEKAAAHEAAPATPAAAAALDRIEFPPEALARISSLMSPGATLIISDQGLGPETGADTDFIVLTR